jgi:hypothetical protein
MFDLFGKLGKIGIGCGITGAILGSLAGLVGIIVAGIVTGLPAWAIVLIGLVVLLIGGGIFATFYFVFKAVLGPEVERRKLLESGEPAEATILAVTDTGVTVNQIYPVVKVLLEVRPQGRQPYQVETKMILNRMDIPQIQPGKVVQVRFDPRNPEKVAVVGVGPQDTIITPGSPAEARVAEQMLLGAEQANQALRQNGQPAQAKILRTQALGIEVNGPNPAMRLLLEVYPTNRPAFQAEAIAVVAQASIPNYQPDKMVFVKFDPNDTTKVAIDHSRP